MSWWIDENKLVDTTKKQRIRPGRVHSWERSRVWFTRIEDNKTALDIGCN